MNEKRPLMITFLGDLYLLSAVISLTLLLFPNLSTRFAVTPIPLPIFSGTIANILIPVILIMMSYGFFKLKKWAYWVILFYGTLFLISNIIGVIKYKQIINYQNIIITLVQLIYIFPNKKHFYN